MDTALFTRLSETAWQIEPTGRMRVPAVIYAGESLLREMDDKVREQLINVTTLPGIVQAAYAMPDAHWGYGFPIGGVAAMDYDDDGVISPGGVGYDINCGVRLMRTNLTQAEIAPRLDHAGFEAIDLVEVLDGLLAGRTLEVRAEIRLRDREEKGEEPALKRLSLLDRGRQGE